MNVVSPPFTLNYHDYKSLGVSLMLAIIGALFGFVTSTLLPTMKEHVANDWGVIILTMVTAGTPVIANALRKLLTYSVTQIPDADPSLPSRLITPTMLTKIGLAFLMFMLTFMLASTALAAEAQGMSGDFTTIPIIGPLIAKLLSQWWGPLVLIIGVPIILTKIWPKIDLSRTVLPFVVKFATWALTAAPKVPVLVALHDAESASPPSMIIKP